MTEKVEEVVTVKLTKAERHAAHMKQRAEVLKALQKASIRCRHHKTIGLKIRESCEYVTFLEKLSVALARFATNPNAYDVGFRMFLPTKTMREAVESLGIKDLSQFIEAPLEDAVFTVEGWGMEWPPYVGYFHPDFED